MRTNPSVAAKFYKMSAAEEDTELRDLLVQTLEKNGILGKIKAELRSSIFLALETQDLNKSQVPLRNVPLQQFNATDDGRVCSAIVNEFLNFFNLDYTAAVFKPEANIVNEDIRADELFKSLNLSPEKKEHRSPLLLKIILAAKSKKNSSENIEYHQIEFLRSKFDPFINSSSGVIDKKDVTAVISLACPTFHPMMLEGFVADEFKNKFSSGVSFDEFLEIFRKLFSMCQSITSVGTNKSSPLIPSKQTVVKSPDKPSPEKKDHYYSKQQNQKFHEVPSENTKKNSNEGVPAGYLVPSDSLSQDVSMEEKYDDFFDSKPEQKSPDGGAASRLRTADSGYSGSRMSSLHDAPAITPSMTEPEWQNKKQKTEFGSASYDDDFHSEQSISEEIQELSNNGDVLLRSSDKDESLDLTEDRTVSEMPAADYMEDVRQG